MLVAASCKEIEKDNKAMESKSSPVINIKEAEKVGKTEKRGLSNSLLVASHGGDNPNMLHFDKSSYTIEPMKYRQEVPFTTLQPDVFNAPQFLASGSPTTKPQYIMYAPPPQPPHMLLMLAVPHPSGQFLMLLPAQNLIYPMFYRPPALPQLTTSVPVPSYQTSAYQQTTPPLSQTAGFVAQHQLAYSGPYRTDKYQNSKQN